MCYFSFSVVFLFQNTLFWLWARFSVPRLENLRWSHQQPFNFSSVFAVLRTILDGSGHQKAEKYDSAGENKIRRIPQEVTIWELIQKNPYFVIKEVGRKDPPYVGFPTRKLRVTDCSPSRSYWLWHFKVKLWGFELISNYHSSITKRTP